MGLIYLYLTWYKIKLWGRSNFVRRVLHSPRCHLSPLNFHNFKRLVLSTFIYNKERQIFCTYFCRNTISFPAVQFIYFFQSVLNLVWFWPRDVETCSCIEQWRTEGGCWGGFNPPPPPKFRSPSKTVPNSTQLWKLLKVAEFRTPAPQDVRKKGSKILKLPSVRNCFTLAMTNKLAVIINSLKVPKINKILLYEMKFLVSNYSCLQNPWLGGYRPPDPRSLCPLSSTEFFEPPPKKFLDTPLILRYYKLFCVG